MKTLSHPLFLFAIFASVIAYGFFIFEGAVVFAESSGQYDSVSLRDTYSEGEHHISGMMMVQSACTELQERMDQVTGAYKIVFTTQTTSVGCKEEDTPRAFHIVFAAPPEATFIATKDDAPLPINIVRQ